MAVFGVILVLIFPHLDGLQTRITPNTDTLGSIDLLKKNTKIRTKSVYDTVSEFYTGLAEIYFDEYNDISDTKRKNMGANMILLI